VRLIPCVVLFAACSSQQPIPELDHRSTFEQRTRGVVLHNDGDGGHAGMNGTNCPFDTSNGRVTGDYELDEEGEEEVEDVGNTPLGNSSVLMTLRSNAYIVFRDGDDWEYSDSKYRIPKLKGARFWSDGIVALVSTSGGCAVNWYDFDGRDLASYPVDHCASMDATRNDEMVLVADADGADLVTLDGPVDVELDAELTAFDERLGLVYLARSGESEVGAVAIGTTELLWTTTVGGAIVSLTDAGRRGLAIVSIESSSGPSVVLLDGESGEELAAVDTPGTASSMTTSRNGEVLGLIRPEATYLYDLF
jgi:hypothetical protein